MHHLQIDSLGSARAFLATLPLLVASPCNRCREQQSRRYGPLVPDTLSVPSTTAEPGPLLRSISTDIISKSPLLTNLPPGSFLPIHLFSSLSHHNNTRPTYHHHHINQPPATHWQTGTDYFLALQICPICRALGVTVLVHRRPVLVTSVDFGHHLIARASPTTPVTNCLWNEAAPPTTPQVCPARFQATSATTV